MAGQEDEETSEPVCPLESSQEAREDGARPAGLWAQDPGARAEQRRVKAFGGSWLCDTDLRGRVRAEGSVGHRPDLAQNKPPRRGLKGTWAAAAARDFLPLLHLLRKLR